MNLWIVVGDFNCIWEDGEWIEGQPRSWATVKDFNNCINNCGFGDLKPMEGVSPGLMGMRDRLESGQTLIGQWLTFHS